MKQFIARIVMVASVIGLMIAPVAFSTNAAYAACNDSGTSVLSGVNCAQGDNVKGNLFGGSNSLFKVISNTLLFIIGAISVIMLIIGGFRYVVSQGDSTQVTAAKNTILYAVIGIIVALLAYAIVNFVVAQFIKT
jgi:hypothetical protein